MKCILIGDEKVGKTSLLNSYLNSSFFSNKIFIKQENNFSIFIYKQNNFIIEFWDISIKCFFFLNYFFFKILIYLNAFNYIMERIFLLFVII